MNKPQYQFKPPPRRFQPRGIEVIYEDRDILVGNKAPGLLTVRTDKEKERTARVLLTNYVRKGNPKSRQQVFTVHRLDRDTSGVIVFAKSFQAKEYLQAEWSTFQKIYKAVVHGRMPEEEGMIRSYLVENKAYVMYSVQDPNRGKLAITQYEVVGTSKRFSLLDVQLHTGRKNQIRVHLADQGCPVVGDNKYGDASRNKGFKRLALHAAELVIRHPHSKEELMFEVPPSTYFDQLMTR